MINTAAKRLRAYRVIQAGGTFKATHAGVRITLKFGNPVLTGERIEWEARQGKTKTRGMSQTVFDALEEIQTLRQKEPKC